MNDRLTVLLFRFGANETVNVSIFNNEMVNGIQLFRFVSTVVSFKLYTATIIILQALYILR
jgi:hypothetical protein